STMVSYFNHEEFAKDGGLWAWPSLRTLDKATGQSRNTILAAIKDLEAAGYLEVHRRYDPVRRRYKSHLYQALVPGGDGSKPGKKTYPILNQGGSDGCTRVVQTGGTDSMTENKNDSTGDSDNARELATAPPTGALRSRAKTQQRAKNEIAVNAAKGEFDEGSPSLARIPTSQSETAETEAPDKPYADIDIKIVRTAIEDRGLKELADIVGYARAEKGRFLTAQIIEAMCSDGLFVRDGDNIGPTAPPASR